MSVIDFAAAKQEREPHWAGTCVCLGCRHEWQGVGPIGITTMDCPNCELPKGVTKYPFGAQEGDRVFVCNCGSEALTAYWRGGKFWLRCMGCGVDHTVAVFGDA